MTQFDRLFYQMKKPWVMGLYVICIILTYEFIDKSLAIYLHQFDIRTHAHLLNILTFFGNWEIYGLVFLCAALYFRYLAKDFSWEKRAWFLFACVFLANLVGLILKVSLSRARPDLWFSQGLFGFYWFTLGHSYWSFPSGHTITVVSLAAGLGCLYTRYFFAFLSLALLIALTRVLLYYHYLSDVMTAFYLGILVVGIITHYLQKKHYLNNTTII
ncbi:MAG: phosphatase PAP2 family protein [bacterium]|nr:phosphatase PAP2 family protein [bacterium]